MISMSSPTLIPNLSKLVFLAKNGEICEDCACEIFQILSENKISSNLAQRSSIIISTGDPSFKPKFQRIGSHRALWCPRGVCQQWPKFWHHRLSPSFLEISNSTRYSWSACQALPRYQIWANLFFGPKLENVDRSALWILFNFKRK